MKMSVVYIFLYRFYRSVEKPAAELQYGIIYIIWTTLYIPILACYFYLALKFLINK